MKGEGRGKKIPLLYGKRGSLIAASSFLFIATALRL
jgi:hypothetical protein